MNQVLFIPGLGDGGLTIPIANRWKNSKRQVIIFETKWSTNESYSKKYARLQQICDQIVQKGELIIVGVSAGGSLAVRLIAEYPEIKSAHIVSGKNQGSETIGIKFQKRAPALLKSVIASEKAMINVNSFENKTTVYRPWLDNIVPLGDMLVGDCKRRRVPAIGHGMGIAAALLFYLP